jgi:ppGpp synthetase/RelA/SpoT-type nucleotidyltranferase
LVEVEDQVAGRILVFFPHDLSVVEECLDQWFTGLVEATKKRPQRATEFGYESDHYILVIDEHLKPEGWYEAGAMPTTFELQIRTLFMHAWAEPQHDLGYKGAAVTDDHRRMLAWVAASAWGADRMFEDAWGAIAN